MSNGVHIDVSMKNECCGCAACYASCPVKAITMSDDEEGFLYPHVDSSLCMECGRCLLACSFERPAETSGARGSYAAVARNVDLSKSASGGIFASLASSVIHSGGSVFGCAYGVTADGNLKAAHIQADDFDALQRLCNSKYVQSDTRDIFSQVHDELRKGRDCLFSGTPCQVSALRSYLQKGYENLYTVDLVCHGVPSPKLFDAYQNYIKATVGSSFENVTIRDFVFRSKRDGWDQSLTLLVLLEQVKQDGSTNCCERYIPSKDSSYYDLFLKLATLRESCYQCPYAGLGRSGDVTIGDFWGFQKELPELLSDKREGFSMRDGVSCTLVNTDAGERLLSVYGSDLKLVSVDLDAITRNNDQLREPAFLSPLRDKYMSLFVTGGYEAMEGEWERMAMREKKAAAFKRLVPPKLKAAIKSILGR